MSVHSVQEFVKNILFPWLSCQMTSKYLLQQIKQSKAFSFLLWLWKSLGENKKRITALSIYVLSKNDIYHLFFNEVKNMLCYIKQKKNVLNYVFLAV